MPGQLCPHPGLTMISQGTPAALSFSNMGVPWVRMGVMESWSPKMNSIGADCAVT